MAGLKDRLKGALRAGLRLVPRRLVAPLILALARMEARRRGPREGLRFLFHLDAELYGLQGQEAVAYEGGGQHARHRLTGYRDFFVQRIQPGEKVLDIGCGVGLLAWDLAERSAAQVVALDHDPGLIETARRDHPHPRVEYLLGDALTGLPAGRFAVIVLSNVLEHLPERPAFLRGLVRAHGAGRLLLRVPLYERDWRVPLKQELGVDWRLDPTHHTEYTLESFALEMEQAGLTVVEQQVRWGEIWAEARPQPARGDDRP